MLETHIHDKHIHKIHFFKYMQMLFGIPLISIIQNKFGLILSITILAIFHSLARSIARTFAIFVRFDFLFFA